MPKSVLKTIILCTLTLASFQLFFAVAADITAPVTTRVQTPAAPDGDNGWYVTPLQFELTATDLESGVKEINYRKDGGIWQKVEFADSLNLAPNPSFETPAGTSAGVASWEATVFDGSGSYTYDTGEYALGFASASERMVATDGTWHGIKNQTSFSAASPFGNMTASAWIKTNNIIGNAYFKMYSVSQDGSGSISYIYLGESTKVSGTNDWSYIKLDYIVNDTNSIGVYMDLGLEDTGTIWADAVVISESLTSAVTTVNMATDGTGHTFEYYSVDVAGNSEAHACPATNCVSFKLDQTPPGGWYDSGAFRGFFGASYLLWTYTRVKDATSGLSVFTDKFQIKTELHPEYGRYSNFLTCGSTWQPGGWVILISPPFVPGVKEAYLLAPKTSFCNDNWNICKLVRFYSKDMAGNEAYKEFCVNGPWIRLRGEGWVRSDAYIDMLAEGDEDNTDSVIEIGQNIIDYFTSSKDWEVNFSPTPEDYKYDRLWAESDASKEKITDGKLKTDSKTYYVDSDLTLDAADIPGNYDDDTFNQVVFVNGDLTVNSDLEVHNNSTTLFIVKGDANIGKDVLLLDAAIFADGNINTAYDLAEGDSTEILVLKGLFVADKFILQRTLVGTSNSDDPSEDFIYEPKYTVQLQGYFGEHHINWRSVE